jgi:hypothetical protein
MHPLLATAIVILGGMNVIASILIWRVPTRMDAWPITREWWSGELQRTDRPSRRMTIWWCAVEGIGGSLAALIGISALAA